MARIRKYNSETDETKEIELNPNYTQLMPKERLAVYLFICELGFVSFSRWIHALDVGLDKMKEMEEFKDLCYNIKCSGKKYIYSKNNLCWILEE